MDDHPYALDRRTALDHLAAGCSRGTHLWIPPNEAHDLIAPHLDRLLRLAFLPAETPGHFWPAYVDDAQLHAIVWQTLMTPEPVTDTACPRWCDEHPTRHRHSVLDADDGPHGPLTLTHSRAVGAHVVVEHSHAAPTRQGPSMPIDDPHAVLAPDCAERPLTSHAARLLAADLLAAADLLDTLNEPTQGPSA